MKNSFKLRNVLFFEWDTFETCRAVYSDLKIDEYNKARGIKKSKSEKKVTKNKSEKKISKDK